MVRCQIEKGQRICGGIPSMSESKAETGTACGATSSDDQHPLAARDEEARCMSKVLCRMAAARLRAPAVRLSGSVRLLQNEQHRSISCGAVVHTDRWSLLSFVAEP